MLSVGCGGNGVSRGLTGSSGVSGVGGDQSDADFGVAEQRGLPAGETHVAGENELVTDAARAAANLGDADDRRGCEAQHKFAPKAKHLWPLSCFGYVEMGDEEIGIRRLENHHFDGRFGFEAGDELSQFDDG